MRLTFFCINFVVLKNICIFALQNKGRGVAQSGSAPGLGPGGRRFESCRPDTSFLADSFLGSAISFSVRLIMLALRTPRGVTSPHIARLLLLALSKPLAFLSPRHFLFLADSFLGRVAWLSHYR